MEHSTPLSPSLPAASEVYGLEELLAVAGERLGEEITPRTVRLYATQGLIDRPGREGRSAVYGRRHLLQLLLIRSLARRGLSLAAIAPLIGLADDDLEEQLRQLQGDADGTSPGVAVAAFGEVVAAAGPPAAAADTRQPRSSQRSEALDYLQTLQASAPSSAAQEGPSRLERQPRSGAQTASLLPLLGSPLSGRGSGLGSSRSPSNAGSRSPSRSPSRSGGSREAASRWHRFTLAPGVELQISESVVIPPAGSRRRAWLDRLIMRLLEQLEDGPP